MKLTGDDARGALAGLVAAGSGLALSELLSGWAHLRVSPIEAVAEGVIQVTPGSVDEFVVSRVGSSDKPLVIALTLLVAALVSAGSGVLARRSKAAAEVVFAALGAVVLVAVHDRLPPSDARYLPAAAGIVLAMVLLPLLSDRAEAGSARATAERHVPELDAALSRRSFLQLTAVVAVSAATAGVFGRVLAAGRSQVEAARRQVAAHFRKAPTPPGVSVDVAGVDSWVTPAASFYRVDTSLAVPLLLPDDWRLRVHGLVDREITLTYDDLLRRGLEEAWVTLCCVSNEVGGHLVGNASWSGVRIAPILAEAGVHADADAVLSRSVDGWTAGTPLSVLTDGRNAMLALGMNGRPLTPEHGFPVRMVVPGLYGYVSATKWVVDLEVTRFSDFTAFWTDRGWSPQGPVKTESRIDVPRNGTSVAAGTVAVAGVAWAQHRGIRRVEVRVDDGPWRTCRLAADPTTDSWRQWVYEWQATPGEHTVAVRATDDTGAVQTPLVAPPAPNGASGYHTITVTVT